MFGLVRTAVRFFVIGLAVGVLLAPRRGAETRALIRQRVNEIANSLLEIADLPPVQLESEQDGDETPGTGDGAPAATRRRGRRQGARATSS